MMTGNRPHGPDDVTLRGAVSFVGFLSVAAPIVAGICTGVWQVWRFLVVGAWPGFSTLDVLRWAGLANGWVTAPTDWVGLWKIADAVNGSLTLFGFGIVVGWVLSVALDNVK